MMTRTTRAIIKLLFVVCNMFYLLSIAAYMTYSILVAYSLSFCESILLNRTFDLILIQNLNFLTLTVNSTLFSTSLEDEF
jgi:hypothetical protein